MGIFLVLLEILLLLVPPSDFVDFANLLNLEI